MDIVAYYAGVIILAAVLVPDLALGDIQTGAHSLENIISDNTSGSQSQNSNANLLIPLLHRRKRYSQQARYNVGARRISNSKKQMNTTDSRAFWQLGSLISTYTEFWAIKFVSYGNYCGLGGSGTPVDRCDECCQVHDGCYEILLQADDCRVYLGSYKYVDVNDHPGCVDNRGTCEKRSCQCDVDMIDCLNRVKGPCDEKEQTGGFNEDQTLLQQIH